MVSPDYIVCSPHFKKLMEEECYRPGDRLSGFKFMGVPIVFDGTVLIRLEPTGLHKCV